LEIGSQEKTSLNEEAFFKFYKGVYIIIKISVLLENIHWSAKVF